MRPPARDENTKIDPGGEASPYVTQRVIGVKKERGPPPMMVVVVASAVFGSSISGLRKRWRRGRGDKNFLDRLRETIGVKKVITQLY